MRIATTLLLGATALMIAVPGHAQPDDAARSVAKPTPAVMPMPDKPQAARTARLISSADSIPPTASAPPTASTSETAPGATAPGGAQPPAIVPATTPTSTPTSSTPVQEAKIEDNDPFATLVTTEPVNPEFTDAIAATVNDETISEYEIRQRMALYVATSGLHNLTDEQKKRVRGQILQQLEDEKLQLQEAQKKKITVSPAEVDKRVNLMLAQDHFTIEQLRKTLTDAGASEYALRSQITAAIAWQKAVQDEYEPKVNVTPEMVDAEIARNQAGADKPHFLVSEIFLPVDNPDQNAAVKKTAEEIEQQLQAGAPFPLVARQFSQHPTAASGGDIGWVYQGQLAPELNQALAGMHTGDVSPPIRSTGGWYILSLRQRQEPLGTPIVHHDTKPLGPDSVLPLARLLLPMPPDTPKDEMDKVLTVASNIQHQVRKCEQLSAFHKKLPGSVYTDLGDMKLGDLSPQMRQALLETKAGDVAAPFTDAAGIEIIARCDTAPPVLTAYKLPTREEVENQLFQEQISAMARHYLRDLRRAASIQVRDFMKAEVIMPNATEIR
jgi:peptidyl-prolyl cis-trans isomerase SurA